METLIFDTAAVLNLGHRGELSCLLKRLSGSYTLLTTDGVVAELTDPKRSSFYKAFISNWFSVRTPAAIPFDLATLARLSQTIDPGEITVLSLAKELNAIAVLDDRAALREAISLKIAITGTLGLMHKAVTSKWMTEAECLAAINKLCDAGFTIPRPIPAQTLVIYMEMVREPQRQEEKHGL